MPRINLPPGCAGFADGNKKYLAERGPGSFVNLDSDRDAHALQGLKNQDYASAGLVDAGPEKAYIRSKKQDGRWCRECNRLWHSWTMECPKGHGPTTPESEMEHPRLEGPYIP